MYVLVLCLRLSAKVSKLAMSMTLSSVNINITQVIQQLTLIVLKAR